MDNYLELEVLSFRAFLGDRVTNEVNLQVSRRAAALDMQGQVINESVSQTYLASNEESEATKLLPYGKHLEEYST